MSENYMQVNITPTQYKPSKIYVCQCGNRTRDKSAICAWCKIKKEIDK